MPSATWARLPAEKRGRIMAVCREEFAAHGYSDASLNRISKDADVAKGSLFQYFTNKLDLWDMITRDAAERTFEAAVASVGPVELGLFLRLEQLALGFMRHLHDGPIDCKLVAATIDTGTRSARDVIRQSTNKMYADYVGPIVQDGVKGGEVDAADADELLTLMILILRFLANAPFKPDRDPVLGLHLKPWHEIEVQAVALVRRLEPAFGAGGRGARQFTRDQVEQRRP